MFDPLAKFNVCTQLSALGVNPADVPINTFAPAKLPGVKSSEPPDPFDFFPFHSTIIEASPAFAVGASGVSGGRTGVVLSDTVIVKADVGVPLIPVGVTV